MKLGAEFRDGYLAATDREVAILSVAAVCRSLYVFELHAPIAKRAGLAEDQVQAIWEDIADASLWSSRQSSIITFVRDLLADDAIDDESWNGVLFRENPTYMIELISLVGFYRMMAEIVNAVQMKPDEF